MKRETKTNNVPFYKDLVFYAPLSEGDLSDHISGANPTIDDGCSVVWDNEKHMYLTNTVGALHTSLKYDCLKEVFGKTDSITLVIDIEEKEVSSIYCLLFGTPDYSYTMDKFGIAYMRHDRFNTSAEEHISGRIAYVFDGIKQKTYLNGNLIWETSGTEISGLPFGGVFINETASNVYSNSMYVKNARIYGRALNEEEIRQL